MRLAACVLSLRISTGLHKARVFERAAIKKTVVSKTRKQKYTMNAVWIPEMGNLKYNMV